MPLRIPAVLAFTVVGAAAIAGGLAASCGGSPPGPDASSCPVICVPQGTGTSSCPPTTCATGSNHDVCPAGCVPEPIA